LGWTIEYWDGSKWVSKDDAIFKRIEEELNGHEEFSFTVPNTEENRAWVAADRRVRAKFNDTVVWTGLMMAVEYKLDVLECTAYIEAYAILKRRIFSGEYVNTAANIILGDVCDAARISMGVCPTNILSLSFDHRKSFDVVKLIAEACGADFWGDYDASGNPRINIGSRGESKGSVTPISWPTRSIDRSKQCDKVIVRGVSVQGHPIEGVAGTGDNVAFFEETNVTDVETLNSIAAKKLEELNSPSVGTKLTFVITDVYDVHAGDTITLNNPSLDLSGDYRVLKITKKKDTAKIEIEKMQPTIERRFEGNESDLTFHRNRNNINTIIDNRPSAPNLTMDCISKKKQVDDNGFTLVWLEIAIPRVAGAGGYIVGYRRLGESEWIHLPVQQPTIGNPTVRTPNLAPGETYEIHVCALSKLGVASDWAPDPPLQVTLDADSDAPPTPTGLTATPTTTGVLLEWNPVDARDLDHYKIYKGTTNNPTELVGETKRPFFFWKKKNTDDYTTYYFAVSAVDTSGNESEKCTAVAADPEKIKDEDVFEIEADKIHLDGAVYLSHWGHTDDMTKIDGGKIYTGSIEADQIATGAIKSRHIEFDAVLSDAEEPDKDRTLWYREDIDQLRFRGTGGKVGYIPRYPLVEQSAPPENLLPNPCFEIDHDGDGVPDFWEFYWEEGGEGNYGDDEVNHAKGTKSAYINQTNTTGHGAYRSPYIPVHGGKKYYASVYVKVSEGTETFNPLAIEWFDKDKNFISASDMDNKEIGTDFTLCELEATAPSNARYARIYLGNRGISGKWVYFDDVVFSEMRAATPIDRLVCASSDITTTQFTPTGEWQTLFTIEPNEDTEVYFIQFAEKNAMGNVRVKIGNDFYPSENGMIVESVSVSGFAPPDRVLFTIPRNVNGETIEIQIRVTTSDAFMAWYYAWGHSPHYHR